MRDLYPRFFVTGFGALQSINASTLLNWPSRAASIGTAFCHFKAERITRAIEALKGYAGYADFAQAFLRRWRVTFGHAGKA